MMFLGQRRKKHAILTLQLTAMIDVFSMIIFFLIKGTVFGLADVPVPADFKLPKSVSKESVESAPSVIIGKDKVRFSVTTDEVPIRTFAANPRDPKVLKMKKDIKTYIERLPASAKRSGALLNVIADKGVPYQNVFDMVRMFREGGFDTLLFVATGEST